jgi:antitoxin component of RelBE/YafQ-DinJ toxin-antitoxin module
MATKLTLRLDEGVIRDAKRAAQVRGVSLSEMVSGYFRAVCRSKKMKIEATSPVLAEISGVLASKTDPKKLIASYHKHLQEKYR